MGLLATVAADPTGPGYGSAPEDNPQMVMVEGKESTHTSPGGVTYEYHAGTDQQWFPPADTAQGPPPM